MSNGDTMSGDRSSSDDERCLMNILEKIQRKDGYLSLDSLKRVSDELNIPLAQIYATASFYSFFTFKEGKKHVIRVCKTLTCELNGCRNIVEAITKETGLNPGESNDKFSFEVTECIGCCHSAPAMLLDDVAYGNLTEESVGEILKEKCSR